MRVNCYNACSQPLHDVSVGDVFYHDDILYMRVSIETPIVVMEPPSFDPITAVDLARGVVTCFDSGTIVTKAEASVVCE